jgi:glutaredoxin-related protein
LVDVPDRLCPHCRVCVGYLEQEEMTYDYQGSLSQKLVDELLEVVHRYDETIMVATAIGCLEIAKAQVLLDHMEVEDDDDL